MRAVWNGVVVADSNDTVVVEGNHYFPLASVDMSLLQGSETTTVCGWKGLASYYSIVVDGKVNTDAVWIYREPKSAASAVAGRVAFWRGVEVVP